MSTIPEVRAGGVQAKGWIVIALALASWIGFILLGVAAARTFVSLL
jgi:hypothetical protein